nr:MAG TPA: hypothetical protein [Caudoviricetes sp.]
MGNIEVCSDCRIVIEMTFFRSVVQGGYKYILPPY